VFLEKCDVLLIAWVRFDIRSFCFEESPDRSSTVRSVGHDVALEVLVHDFVDPYVILGQVLLPFD